MNDPVLLGLVLSTAMAAAGAIFKAGRLSQKVNGLEATLERISGQVDRLVDQMLRERD